MQKTLKKDHETTTQNTTSTDTCKIPLSTPSIDEADGVHTVFGPKDAKSTASSKTVRGNAPAKDACQSSFPARPSSWSQCTITRIFIREIDNEFPSVDEFEKHLTKSSLPDHLKDNSIHYNAAPSLYNKQSKTPEDEKAKCFEESLSYAHVPALNEQWDKEPLKSARQKLSSPIQQAIEEARKHAIQKDGRKEANKAIEKLLTLVKDQPKEEQDKFSEFTDLIQQGIACHLKEKINSPEGKEHKTRYRKRVANFLKDKIASHGTALTTQGEEKIAYHKDALRAILKHHEKSGYKLLTVEDIIEDDAFDTELREKVCAYNKALQNAVRELGIDSKKVKFASQIKDKEKASSDSGSCSTKGSQRSGSGSCSL